jgi:ribosomal protein S18 acetylase RimI-like enzyme
MLGATREPGHAIRWPEVVRRASSRGARSNERTVSMIDIRPADAGDDDAIWAILEPILRDGEAYALPRDWSRAEALAFWRGGEHAVFVAELPADTALPAAPRVVGTYYLQPNRLGGGAHVANCGYATLLQARGQGVARTMCLHSMETARRQGYLAMQFNFVVASNAGAVALWKRLGFEVVGRVPQAFRHPALGLVDALVMYRAL